MSDRSTVVARAVDSSQLDGYRPEIGVLSVWPSIDSLLGSVPSAPASPSRIAAALRPQVGLARIEEHLVGHDRDHQPPGFQPEVDGGAETDGVEAVLDLLLGALEDRLLLPGGVDPVLGVGQRRLG